MWLHRGSVRIPVWQVLWKLLQHYCDFRYDWDRSVEQIIWMVDELNGWLIDWVIDQFTPSLTDSLSVFTFQGWVHNSLLWNSVQSPESPQYQYQKSSWCPWPRQSTKYAWHCSQFYFNKYVRLYLNLLLQSARKRQIFLWRIVSKQVFDSKFCINQNLLA